MIENNGDIEIDLAQGVFAIDNQSGIWTDENFFDL